MPARMFPSLVPTEFHVSNEGGGSAVEVVERYIQESRASVRSPRSWSTNTLSCWKNLKTLGIAIPYAALADVMLGMEPSRDKARNSITYGVGFSEITVQR